MFDSSAIKVKCKNCGRMANAEEFVLDNSFKMMVCPACIKDKNKISVQKEEPKPEISVQKPAGWDKEDEYLERAFKAKVKQAAVVEKIDSEYVKYTCPHCKYSFKYSVIRKKPGVCPYCSEGIVKINF
ncbi:MAG: hypothetical protein QXD13_02350 [Candidatus Pacearchaeota archaeon]